MLIQIDFEKAFDRVAYESLYETLRFFGFGEKFISYTTILFKDFELCTMNGGHKSDWWVPTRGLFQGNPAALMYFNLFVETLVIMLRANHEIEGIMIEGIKALLSQFADDLSLFIKFKQETWQVVISTLTKDEDISGMKINYDKTSVYRIGAIRYSNAKFYSSRKIHWSKGPVNVLGVEITHKQDLMMELNIPHLIDKARKTLTPWYLRGLNLLGKIEIINSLVVSLFNYRLAVLPRLPQTYIDQIYSLVSNLIWNGKKPKIPLRILCGNKEDRGLGLTDIRVKDNALKLQWIKHLQSNQLLGKLAQVLRNYEGAKITWKVQLNPKDAKYIIRNSLSPFWSDVFINWCTFTKTTPEMTMDIKKQPLWLNSNIKIENQPVLYKDWCKFEIRTVADLLCQNSEFFSYKQLCQRLRGSIPLMKYWGLVCAIPPNWKEKLKEHVEESIEGTPNKFSKVKILEKPIKYFYIKLNANELLLEKVCKRWAKELSCECELTNLTKTMLNVKFSTINVKLRSFQLRLILYTIPTNRKLYHMGIVKNNLCTFCQTEIESLSHLLYYCKKIQPLLNYIRTKVKKDFDCKTFLFNEVEANPKWVINTMTIICKQYIYASKCQNSTPNIETFLKKIQSYTKIEEVIAKEKNKLDHHKSKWEAWKC